MTQHILAPKRLIWMKNEGGFFFKFGVRWEAKELLEDTSYSLEVKKPGVLVTKTHLRIFGSILPGFDLSYGASAYWLEWMTHSEWLFCLQNITSEQLSFIKSFRHDSLYDCCIWMSYVSATFFHLDLNLSIVQISLGSTEPLCCKTSCARPDVHDSGFWWMIDTLPGNCPIHAAVHQLPLLPL